MPRPTPSSNPSPFVVTLRAAIMLLMLSLLSSCKEPEVPARVLDLQVRYRFDSPAPGKEIRADITVALPRSIDGLQEVLELELEPEPQKRWSERGTDYALFRFPGRKDSASAIIRAKVRLDKGPSSSGAPDGNWLGAERWIETGDSSIIAFSDSLDKAGVRGPQALYKAVREAMEYKGYDPLDRGAAAGLKARGGDCSEFTDLLTALFRLRGIPARFAYGYILDYANTPKHAWVEAWINGAWRILDPTFPPPDSSDATLQEGRHFTLSRTRSDSLLHGHHYSGYVYWGSEPRFREELRVAELRKKP